MLTSPAQIVLRKTDEVSAQGRNFTVQTEHVPTQNAIDSTVWSDGAVIFRDRIDYTEHVGRSNLQACVEKALAALHRRTVGRYCSSKAGSGERVGLPSSRRGKKCSGAYAEQTGEETIVDLPECVPPRVTGRPALVAEEEACEQFECFLESRRADPQGARAALMRAIELDPLNRVYRANLRKFDRAG